MSFLFTRKKTKPSELVGTKMTAKQLFYLKRKAQDEAVRAFVNLTAPRAPTLSDYP